MMDEGIDDDDNDDAGDAKKCGWLDATTPRPPLTPETGFPSDWTLLAALVTLLPAWLTLLPETATLLPLFPRDRILA